MRYVALSLLLVLSLSMTGIPVQSQTQPTIVATMSFIGDFAGQLVGNPALVHSIVSGNVDPHTYEPTAEDLVAIEHAQVILAVGNVEIDGWLTSFLNDNPAYAAKVHYVLNLTSYLKYDPLIDAVNPHFWLSPRYAFNMTNSIADILNSTSMADPATISANLNTIHSKFNDLFQKMADFTAIYNGTKVVEDHPAFFYFLNDLGMQRVGVLEQKEGVDPSPQHLQDLLQTMQKDNVSLIVASSIQAGSSVQELARNSHAKVAYLTPLPTENESYINMMLQNLLKLQSPESISAQADFPIPLFVIAFGMLVIIRKSVNKQSLSKRFSNK